jgi:hypothetical protein
VEGIYRQGACEACRCINQRACRVAGSCAFAHGEDLAVERLGEVVAHLALDVLDVLCQARGEQGRKRKPMWLLRVQMIELYHLIILENAEGRAFASWRFGLPAAA